MSAAPGISRKRGNIEVSNLMSLNFNMGLANLNRSLDSFKRTIESDLNQEIVEDILIQINHEYPLMSMVQDRDAKDMLLVILKDESCQDLCFDHGIATNGRSRGDSTRVVMNITKWRRFTHLEMALVFEKLETLNSKRYSHKKENNVIENDQEHSLSYLNFHYQRNKEIFVAHIIKQYALKESLNERVIDLEGELKERDMTISVFEFALRKEQRKTSAQKGWKTR
jgi:hypothetical protein